MQTKGLPSIIYQEGIVKDREAFRWNSELSAFSSSLISLAKR